MEGRCEKKDETSTRVDSKYMYLLSFLKYMCVPLSIIHSSGHICTYGTGITNPPYLVFPGERLHSADLTTFVLPMTRLDMNLSMILEMLKNN